VHCTINNKCTKSLSLIHYAKPSPYGFDHVTLSQQHGGMFCGYVITELPTNAFCRHLTCSVHVS